MTAARNVGLLRATGLVIAFVDDDAYVRDGWLAAVTSAFDDPRIGAVAGRTCNGRPGEETEGREMIGRVLPDGSLTGHFAADVEIPRDVEHGIGANMAFRRSVLAELGGFRDDYVGVGGVREDTDMFLRVRTLGYRVVFVPQAVVDHVGAPHARGRRFDYRYMFTARRNHVLLLSRNFGLCSSRLRRWIVAELQATRSVSDVSAPRRLLRLALAVLAVTHGLGVSVWKARCRPVDPRRTDQLGISITRHLGLP
jgi:GT2 family glycosyltransferase